MPVDDIRWVLREQDPAGVAALAGTLDTTPLVAHILLNRGYGEVSEAERFLDCRLEGLPDPFLLRGMDRAVDRIVSAMASGEKILIHGDYDADGVTATSLLLLFFRDLGYGAMHYIPKRVEEGYGVNPRSIRSFREKGIGLIVTADCGISSVEEIALAKSLGMGVVVTDHHEPPAVLPDADALIDPLLPGCLFPSKAVSGVGLAFFLADGVREGLRGRGFFAGRPEPSPMDYLDLVAIGTIADIIPLNHLNRTLVRAGLERINRNPRPGIRALMEVCGIAEGQVDSGAVAYRIAPKINAAGRLEDAEVGVRLLTTRVAEEASMLANSLDFHNMDRQEIEERIFREAMSMIQSGDLIERRRSIVLHSADWHPGVVGIVASRLVERYYRPTVLLCRQDGTYKGSARSIPDFHLYHGLNLCRDLLLEFGGHKLAAGIRVDPSRLESFALRFDEVVRSEVAEEGFIPVLTLDAQADLGSLTVDGVRKIQALSPFGAGNPEPIVLLQGVRAEGARVVGSGHLSFTARQGDQSMDAIAFRQAHKLEQVGSGPMELAVIPEVQTWRGRTRVKLRVRGMRPDRNA